jgi:O-antigen/teichoic acid export membrane protein
MAAEAGAQPGKLLQKSRAAVSRLPRQGVRRLGWGVADQAVSSLTNFAVTIYVARVLGATQFGAFSLAYVTYAFALTASRGLATDPLMVRFSGTDLPTWRRAVASCTGTAAAAGLVAGGCVLVASAFLSGTTQAAFFALGLTLPGLLLQDSWRYSFFALGRGSQAFLNDMTWAAVLVPALVALRVTGHADVFWYVFAWGTAAAAGAAVGPLQARVIPRVSAAWQWISQHRDLGPRYLAENASNSGASQLRLYGVGLIVGVAAAGYVQAANTLMGPFLVVFMGFSLVTIPEAAQVLRRSPRHLRLFCLAVGGGLAILGLAWGLALLVALPRGLGDWLLGSIWRPTYPLVLPLTISVGGACVSAGATAGLHALGAARRSLRAMIITSAAYLGFGVAGAFADGAAGSVAGVAVATWVGAAAWWWQLQAALREAGHAPAPSRLRRQRASGRHRMPGPALAASADLATAADLMVPLDTGPAATLAAPEATIRPSPPNAESLLAGQRPKDRTAARPPAQQAPRPPRRRRMPAAAKAALATGAMAMLVAATGVGWILTHQRAGAHATAGVQGPASAQPSTPASAPPSAIVTVHALKPVSASSFDPYGDGQGENSHLAPLAIDNSRATSWHTDWYTTARFGNLKPGTGLLLDMGKEVTITAVRLWLGSANGADLQVRAGDATSSLRELVPAARAANAGGKVSLQLAKPVHARYVLIWFTKLPPDNSGTFQASVFNVKLEGTR